MSCWTTSSSSRSSCTVSLSIPLPADLTPPGLLSNQNTMQYGGVQADGVWRDEDGKTLIDYGATGGGGFMSGVSAFIAFAKTAAK